MIDALGGGRAVAAARSTPTTPGGQDGLPRFCDQGDPSAPSTATTPRYASSTAAPVTMPIWESCVARPAFRSLFNDWENGSRAVPGPRRRRVRGPGLRPGPTDVVASRSTRRGVYHDAGTNASSSAATTTSRSARSTRRPARASRPADLELRYRITEPGRHRSALGDGDSGRHVQPGRSRRQVRDRDAGRRSVPHLRRRRRARPAEAVAASSTGSTRRRRVCTCDNPPFGATFDTDDSRPSTTRSTTARSAPAWRRRLDHRRLRHAARPPPTDRRRRPDRHVPLLPRHAHGHGHGHRQHRQHRRHRVHVHARRRRRRACSTTSTGPGPKATSRTPACSTASRDKINQAVKKHDAGQHDVEWNALDRVRRADRRPDRRRHLGSGIDTVVGDRFIAYAQDIIARGG